MTFKVRYAREMALVEISDTGPGIAQAELDKVFEPFARGSSAAGNSAGGTGLGLTISKMLTDLMGGEMKVSSQEGVGTTFRIRLFLPQVRASEVAQRVMQGQRTGYAGERRRIWVVDNEEADRGLLVRILTPLGFEVTPLASGPGLPGAPASRPASLHPHALFHGPGHARPGRLGHPARHPRRRPEHRAGCHRVGQRLRQGPGQRRGHHAR